MKKQLAFLLLIGLTLLLLSACGPISIASGGSTPLPVATTQLTPAPPALREALVDSVEIHMSQSEPVQVNAIVRGHLNESCASLLAPQVKYGPSTIGISLMSSSPTDRGCIQITTPFEQTIPLNTAGLAPGTYTVIANGVSTTFTMPINMSQPTAAPTVGTTTTLHLVVQAYDRSVKIVEASIPLDTSVKPFLDGFLPLGGAVDGIGYVIDPNNPEALAIGSTGPQLVGFIQNPAIFGLVVWSGSGQAQPRLAWGTGPSGQDQSSIIMISNLDGTQLETLLTQDTPNPPTQLVPEFWSADGQALYFSKEPLGLGGDILFGGGSSLFKIDIATKQVTELIPLGPPDGPQACLDAVSADFRYVADHCTQKTITVRDLKYGTSAEIQPALESGSYYFAGSARFSPSGNHLAYALAMTEQGKEQGWVALTQLNGGSKVILTSEPGILYTLAGWLDDQTILVQSINIKECVPDCATELWALKIDGSAPTKLGDGKFLALVGGDLNPVPPPVGAPTGQATCQDAAEYIGDDGKDGMTYSPNTPFTKSWTVKNTGTCTWDNSYLVYQASGVYMTQQPGYWLVSQGQTVKPGQSVDISVGMTSPVDNGNYRSDWSLKDPYGQLIPLKGGTANNSFYVEINVDDGTGNGSVTATAIDIVQEQGSGEICSANATYFVHAYISTNGPTTVSYEIGSSAGQIAAGTFEENGKQVPYVTSSLKFDKADNKTINLRFVGPYPYPDNISVMLRVNGGEWVTSKLSCR